MTFFTLQLLQFQYAGEMRDFGIFNSIDKAFTAKMLVHYVLHNGECSRSSTPEEIDGMVELARQAAYDTVSKGNWNHAAFAQPPANDTNGSVLMDKSSGKWVSFYRDSMIDLILEAIINLTEDCSTI